MAAYEHVAMIKLHYKMADALDECIVKLSGGKASLHERPHVTFKPLKEKEATPPPISVEDVPRVVPRVAKDVTSTMNSCDSLSTEDDDEDERNWMPL